MPVEINTAYSDEPLILDGEDARHFMDELLRPSPNPRRTAHLTESASVMDKAGPILDANEVFRQAA